MPAQDPAPDPESQSRNTAAPAEHEELLAEMDRLRKRLEELQVQLDGETGACQRESERVPFKVKIQFITDFDVSSGTGVDISAGGMAVRIDDPIPFALSFEQEGERVLRNAKLIYAKTESGGSHRLGFRFVSAGEEETAR